MNIEEILKDSAGTFALVLIYALKELFRIYKEKREAKKKADKAEKHGIELTSTIDRDIRHVEIGFMTKYRPIRVFVIHFHNGTFTDAGLSLQKMTIRHEIKEQYEVIPLTPTHTEVPIPELLYVMISRVRMQGSHYLRDRDNLLKTEQRAEAGRALYEWLEYYGVRSQYTTQIKDKQTGKIVAMLVLQFSIREALTPQNITEINEQKKRIEKIYDAL